MRRLLYLVHRWLGIASCLLFAMWFASGLVMMYVQFPALTPAERWAGLTPLRLDGAMLGPAEALARVAGPASPAPCSMGLEMLPIGAAAAPVWRIVDAAGRRHVVSARDGRRLGPFGAPQAEAVARAFARQPGARWAETLARDQWTVPQSLDPLRPLHRIEVGDAAGTELYVSAVTGEVVRDTSRAERGWNWIGAVPHWLYFTPLRARPGLWHDVVVWVSAVCALGGFTGMVVGVWRLRLRRRYRDRAVTPYRGWKAWHHLAGLLGGGFVLSWCISGWLSMHPNGGLSSDGFDRAALERYGRPAVAAALPWPPAPPALAEARTLQLLWFDGQPLFEWHDGQGRRAVAAAATGMLPRVDATTLRAAAARLVPQARIVAVERLERDDLHWYSHHETRVLPVWRLRFDDPAGTWAYLDPDSGAVLGRADADTRQERWWFNAPHRFDFPWLLRHRPAWDVLMWTLSGAGLLVALSGTVIGLRRLCQRAAAGMSKAPWNHSARNAGRASRLRGARRS